MFPFPYFEILQKAYQLTRRNKWLWVFGLFIGSSAGFNYGGMNYLLPRARIAHELLRLRHGLLHVEAWIGFHEQAFVWLVVGGLLVGVILIAISGLARAALIWGVARLAEPSAHRLARAAITWKTALRGGVRYFWPILGLQVLVTAAFFIFLILFAVPVSYLFVAGAVGKGVFLSLLGLLIFIPASFVFGFLHLYGPIFIVLYQSKITEAINYSFHLLIHKFKESFLLAAVLVGLGLLFLFGIIFSIVIFAVPVVLLALVLLNFGFLTAVYALAAGASLLLICYTIVLGAGFTVFQNIAWILAVMYLVKAQKAAPAEALAPEPEPVV